VTGDYQNKIFRNRATLTRPEFSAFVFPNPSNDFVNISATKKITRIEIVDAQGRLIKSTNENSSEVKIDVSDLAKGIYFLKVLDENSNSETFRLIRN